MEQIFDQNQIKYVIKEMAQKININYQNKRPLFLCVLKSASKFMFKLIDLLNIEYDYDFIAVKSYQCATHVNNVELILDVEEHIIENRNVIIVDDIYDTGLTLNWLINHIKSKNPLDIKTCVLINKLKNTKIKLPINYSGFTIENGFVVGYGMDYNNKYRNLNDIYELVDE
jgi:hypoxanthine phosphoribosyltransferase